MLRRRLFALIAVLAVAGCGESPSAPTPPDASEGLVPTLGNVDVVRRTAPLSKDESVSKVVGPSGGVISLPNAGLTVVVPAGALTSPVNITVTAPSGSLLGYHFAPHGLVFKKPLVATQKMSGTDLSLGSLLSPPYAAYFEGQLKSKVKALEILNVNVLAVLGRVQFEIPHFSGYVIATD